MSDAEQLLQHGGGEQDMDVRSRSLILLKLLFEKMVMIEIEQKPPSLNLSKREHCRGYMRSGRLEIDNWWKDMVPNDSTDFRRAATQIAKLELRSGSGDKSVFFFEK
jgi:hypothetical protein